MDSPSTPLTQTAPTEPSATVGAHPIAPAGLAHTFLQSAQPFYPYYPAPVHAFFSLQPQLQPPPQHPLSPGVPLFWSPPALPPNSGGHGPQVASTQNPAPQKPAFQSSQPAPLVPDFIPGEDVRELARRTWFEERERLRILEERRQSDDSFLRDQELVAKLKADRARSRIQREEKEMLRRERRIRAATTLQRYYRGHLVRRTITSWQVNDVALVRNPALYFLEKILLEVIRQEFVPDLLVEICQDVYHPVSSTTSFKCYRIRYHLLEEVVQEYLRMIAIETWEEAHNESYSCLTVSTPEQHFLEQLIDEAISNELPPICREQIRHIADEELTLFRSKEILREWIEELLCESELLETVNQELVLVLAFDQLLEDEIDYQIKAIGFQAAKELKTSLYRTVGRQHRSSTLDVILDNLTDNLVVAALIGQRSTDAQKLMEWSAGEIILDEMIASTLLGQSAVLNETNVDFPLIHVDW